MRKDLEFELDMLRGNLNRMCVCDTKEELLDMFAFACMRLNDIYKMNKTRIYEKGEVEQDDTQIQVHWNL